MNAPSPHHRIEFATSRQIDADAFIDLLKRSTLAERRPVEDRECIQAMLDHADLLCTAWDGPTLVGVARSVTDFAYCCYLSDLAVDEKFQNQGIGKELIRLTMSQLGSRVKLILLAAPQAASYYPKIGFQPHPSAWVLSAGDELR